MSDETPGAGQNAALLPREGQGVAVARTSNAGAPDRPTVRLTQVAGGQYVLTSQSTGVPALAQISPGPTLYSSANLVQGNVARIINISPSRIVSGAQLRPSLANQSIVNVLSKSRPNPRIQLFPNTATTSGSAADVSPLHPNTNSSPFASANASSLTSTASTSSVPAAAQVRGVKRPAPQISSSAMQKKEFAAKLERVTNHKLVRSKYVKEQYNEHLMENYHLEIGGNSLDLYQFAKKPRTQQFLQYAKENAIDPKEEQEKNDNLPNVVPSQSIPNTPPVSVVATSTPEVVPTTPVTTTSVKQKKTPSFAASTSASSSTLSNNNQEQIVEKAKQEAYVVQRIADLQKEGLWSERRLPKVQEMQRAKAHWDYLLEEMVWLAADFAQERKWKKAAAKKCARMVQKYFQDKALAAQRAEKAQEQHLRRIASYCAKEIKNFWNNVEKLVEYKQNTILEEKRKKALDQQLSFIVDQTEKYSQLLAEGMNKSNLEVSRSSSRAKAHSDDEFEPVQSDEDDEETIEKEESQVEIVDQKEEIDALQRESQMELDDLLEDDLLRNYLMNRDNIKISESDEDDVESSSSDEEEDDESSEEEEQDSEESGNTAEEEQKDELKMLVEDERDSKTEGQTSDKDDLINDAAAIAESIQPKGNTLSSTTVSTKVPFLLKFPLREYQHIGLDWLVTMYERKLNGILADEMGLGKTIQTIALLAHLACEKENWGPHLIVVPTSVMLNWEMELKKWCPAFKILTYYGTQKERKLKRTGWTKPNAFHVCITSYKLVIQDHQSFRRKKWKYLILDEAQNIKNFKSQRWQLLLNFQTQQRLLLTGTPLQNNLMELWSLMHFLMPNVFQSHREFKEWFSNPVTGMIEGNSEYNESIIKRLHKVLRPFLLRRLKSEVEKQMPKKYEHVVMCRLSKRQRFLYDDYMSRAKTKETLTSGNLLSVINVLMQLRKVCNHPNLFEIRPTISPFQCEGIRLHVPSLVYSALEYDVWQHVSIMHLNMLIIMLEMQLSAYQCYRARQLRTPSSVFEAVAMNCRPNSPPPYPPGRMNMRVVRVSPEVAEAVKNEKKDLKEVAAAAAAAAATASKIVPLSAVQQQNLVKGSYKMTPQYGVQLVSSQGVVKTIPVVNISQATAAAAAAAANANTSGVTSVLKPADKINASFAQLVQTSIGKHLLLTSNPNITGGNIPVTATTAGGQKLTFFSKQPVSTSNASNVVTKAIVKFQLTSVTTATTSTNVTTSSTTAMSEAAKDDSRKTIGVKFIDQLYANQSNNLDVRWGEGGEPTQKSDENEELERKRRCELMARVNERRCTALPLYGRDFQDCIKIFIPNKFNTWTGGRIHCLNTLFKDRLSSVNDIQTTDALDNIMYNPEKRIRQIKDISDRFIFYVPAVKAPEPEMQVWHPPPSKYWGQMADNMVIKRLFSKPATPLHHIASAMVTQFPDPRLIQYDCGKLQTLDRLLRKLKQGNHRVLIFTQMTKMLDVLEAFLNFHGHIYLRLDGSTKVDQRQVLMERFNGDTRIFAFILSTRSGGIGVNLTGADTVIFYDSDWNPTMDAQAQDRCHRIGQTRDVHIYRLISERTIEENILKKANQKRLLGDLAIEGGNFTTAYFKSSTIQDLFNIDQNEESAATRMSEVVDISKEREKQRQQSAEPTSAEDKSSMGALEQALAACEDDQDVIAARTAKAEAVADLAEFDETIPLEEQEKEKEPEMSKAEQEIDNVIKKLSPIERYAMKFIEETESAWSAEQLRAAEREIEEQKREWEQNRLAAMREEEERRARELEEEETNMLTFSREDAMNQIWVSDNTSETMPMWCPPTPPEQHTDVYIDQTMSFLYDMNIMTETQLPPVYVKKEPKRRAETSVTETRRAIKMARKEETTNVPKSIFHSAATQKQRRDLKMQKYRGLMRPTLQQVPAGKSPIPKPVPEQMPHHEWTIHEDMAILKVIQTYQGLPLSLLVNSPGHTPNWDFVADYVNTVSITYRTPKQCRQRYESTLMQREEATTSSQVHGHKVQKSRPMRTSQLYTQDNNSTFAQMLNDRFDSIKRLPPNRANLVATSFKQTATSTVSEVSAVDLGGIDVEHPVLPVEVAQRRAERIAKEKKFTPEQVARFQMLKAGTIGAFSAASVASTPSQSTSTVTATVTTTQQIVVSTVASVATVTTPGTPPLRPQRIIASPLQASTVVSVSGLSPAQLQAATQRLIATASTGQKTVVGAAATLQGKTLSPAQLQVIRATNIRNQLRLQGNLAVQGGVKTSTVTIGGQPAVVQFTQAQTRPQFVRQSAVAAAKTAGGITRTVTESEMAQLLKKQQLQQQQQQQQPKLVATGAAPGTSVQAIPQQVFAQALQAGTSGTQVATLVKAVSSAGGRLTQTVTIPVSGVNLATQGKVVTPTLKTTPHTQQQLRQLQLHQQLQLQKAKLSGQKLNIAHVGKAGGVPTQLIVSPKPMPTSMTVQQFQQVMRTPLNVSPGPVVLAKGPPRVIPVNTAQGTKQTIQVVAATSLQNSALRPQQATSALAGALSGIKVQGTTSSGAQQATLLSVSAALNQNVRQGNPVRIQTASGTPIVAVSVQSPQTVQSQQQQQQSQQQQQQQQAGQDQVSRFIKK